jgi:hypothetical protein
MVMICVAELEPTEVAANVRLEGATASVVRPMPERLIKWGEFGALSVIVTAPRIVPVTVGVKLTVTLQAPDGAMEPTQVVVKE